MPSMNTLSRILMVVVVLSAVIQIARLALR